MRLKIDQKIINGKKVMGLINEDLGEIAPYIFKNIECVEILHYNLHYKYFICVREDETCSLYDYEGRCRINYSDGYKKLKILKYSFCNGVGSTIFVTAEKDNEVGILMSHLDRKDGTERSRLEIAYKFGKCNEIKELDDGTVLLKKLAKGRVYKGYWYHKNIDIGEVIEPKFLSYNYFTIKCKKVGLYYYEDEYDRLACHYQLSDHVEYDKLTLNVEMIEYSRLKNNIKKVGLKQKVCDLSKNSYHPSFKFDDFLPDDYSSIHYDANKQVFSLEQIVDGKIKKGFIGVSFDWHLTKKGRYMWGYPNLKIEVNVPCEYDEQIIDDNYAQVKKLNGWGLIQFSFGRSNGDYWNNEPIYSSGQCRVVAPCIYDSPLIKTQDNNFIGHINNEERIITDCIDQETGENVVVANNYKIVRELAPNIYLCDLESGKKEVVVINKYYSYYYTSTQNSISCIINKISCDSAKIIDNDFEKYLIEIVNDNVTDIYYKNSAGNVERIENIDDFAINNQKFNSESAIHRVLKLTLQKK